MIQLYKAIDKVNKRYGYGAIKRVGGTHPTDKTLP
jgi:hypothetical protein